MIGGMNLLERFLEWIGEKVKDVGRGKKVDVLSVILLEGLY